ncbi:hypothetical protein PanWU01x14_070460 [Parasponia andersonii]|uniref:Uncharacterized protein n=1 Tax=Parasponia andersonii TaxID=3476 RepID=A0A2P5DEZ7_PARAD|nr:hypothetical protein PanWU01x14_070460 [Parasponia andersonii]
MSINQNLTRGTTVRKLPMNPRIFPFFFDLIPEKTQNLKSGEALLSHLRPSLPRAIDWRRCPAAGRSSCYQNQPRRNRRLPEKCRKCCGFFSLPEPIPATVRRETGCRGLVSSQAI